MRSLPVILFATAVSIYVACGGPHDNGNPRQDLYLTLGIDGLARKATTIHIFINGNGAEFAGSDGNCVIGAIVDNGILSSAETASKQLEITIDADSIPEGGLIAICQFSAEAGIDPEFTIEVEECRNGSASIDCTVEASIENIPRCGNNNVDGGEECDDGGVDTADCDNDCTDPECGDDHLNEPAGEDCDDGNTTSNDGCSNECDLEDVTTSTTTTSLLPN